MIFFNIFQQATVMAFAIVAFMAFAVLPTHAVEIGLCYQKANSADPCGGDNKWGSGDAHGVNVVPYNCYAWKPDYDTLKICKDVRCEDCQSVNVAAKTCTYFTPQIPVRCVVYK